MYLSNDISQDLFVYQPTLATLEFKKKSKVLIMLLVGNQEKYITLNLSYYIVLSCVA